MVFSIDFGAAACYVISIPEASLCHERGNSAHAEPVQVPSSAMTGRDDK